MIITTGGSTNGNITVNPTVDFIVNSTAVQTIINGNYGSAGQFLGSTGDGNVYWLPVSNSPGATGPTGAIQLSDGSGQFLGNSNLVWTESIYQLTGGPNDNCIYFDNGLADMYVGNGLTGTLEVHGTNSLVLSSAGIMKTNIYGNYGIQGQFLGSDGSGNVIWTNPPVNTGPQGSQGPTGTGFTFSAESNAVLWTSDGTSVTGTTGFSYTNSPGIVKSNIFSPNRYLDLNTHSAGILASGSVGITGTTGQVLASLGSDNSGNPLGVYWMNPQSLPGIVSGSGGIVTSASPVFTYNYDLPSAVPGMYIFEIPNITATNGGATGYYTIALNVKANIGNGESIYYYDSKEFSQFNLTNQQILYSIGATTAAGTMIVGSIRCSCYLLFSPITVTVYVAKRTGSADVTVIWNQINVYPLNTSFTSSTTYGSFV